MKIECDIGEFQELQNVSKLERKDRAIEAYHADFRVVLTENERLAKEKSKLEDRIYNLETQLNESRPIACSQNLEQLSMIFAEYLSNADKFGGKIAAIKKTREIFQCGLKEAKMVVEGTYHKTPENQRW